MEISADLQQKIKAVACTMYANAGPNTFAPRDGNSGILCPEGHSIIILPTSDLYESSTGKQMRARCSGGEMVFEW